MAVNTATFLGENRREKIGRANVLSAIRKKFGDEAAGEVDDAIRRARKAGVPWLQILGVLLPLLLTIFTGGSVDIQAIINAILDLFK